MNPEEFEPHNLPLVVLGTFALWFGWYGFNPGSTLTMKTGNDGALAAQVAMNTTLAAATGGITVFVLRYFITKKYDVGGLCNGILAGLVSITAGCGSMECGSAFATGLIGGFVYQGASMLLQKLKVDDPVDASPVHGFCGIWGCMAVALFDWGKGFDHYHGWSGWSCTPGSDGVSCKTGANGTGLGANVVMVPCGRTIAPFSAFLGRLNIDIGGSSFCNINICNLQIIFAGAHDHRVGWFPVRHFLLRPQEDAHVEDQRGGGRDWHGLSPPLPAQGLFPECSASRLRSSLSVPMSTRGASG